MQINELLAKIEALKAEIDQLRPLKPEVEHRIMQKFRLDWNYHSNAIEGNSLTLGETRAFLLEGLTASGKPLKDHVDIKGHNNLIGFLTLFIQRQEELTEADIREMHKILLHEPYETEAVTLEGRLVKKWVIPGKYKETQNFVRTGSGTIHQYALPEEVDPKMYEMLMWHRTELKKKELHPVVHAAFFHHRFLAIHPFDDGNGRLARILMNLILMRHGFPPVVIKLAEREPYVAALRQADGGESSTLVSFIAQNLLDSEVLYLRGARGESIEDSDDLDKAVALLKQELKNSPQPVELTTEVQRLFFKEKLTPLLNRIDKKLTQYDEFFANAYVEVRHDHPKSQGKVEHLFRSQVGDSLLEILLLAAHEDEGVERDLGLGIGLFWSVELLFRWEAFQRDGTNCFSVQVGFSIKFEKYKYHFECVVAGLNTALLHQHWLTEDEINRVVTALAKSVLEQIQLHLRSNIQS
jgi:Fic family protein